VNLGFIVSCGDLASSSISFHFAPVWVNPPTTCMTFFSNHFSLWGRPSILRYMLMAAFNCRSILKPHCAHSNSFLSGLYATTHIWNISSMCNTVRRSSYNSCTPSGSLFSASWFSTTPDSSAASAFSSSLTCPNPQNRAYQLFSPFHWLAGAIVDRHDFSLDDCIFYAIFFPAAFSWRLVYLFCAVCCHKSCGGYATASSRSESSPIGEKNRPKNICWRPSRS